MTPFTLLHLGAQMVEPSVSALLAISAFNVISTLGPLIGTILLDPLNEDLILVRGPHSFNEPGF